MDQKTRAILLGGVALLILAATFGIIFYLGKASRNKTPESSQANLNSLSTLPQIATSPAPTTAPENKTFIGEGFNLKYPGSWGLLTCSNSQSFELDPLSGQEIKGVVCDFAVKPATFIVAISKPACTGETIVLGSNQVTRSKTASNGDTTYRWCLTVAGKNFDISHRVSQSGSRATSKNDLSSQIEEVIKSLQASPAGS